MPEQSMITPATFAVRLSVSPRTARRIMQKIAGVLVLGDGERRTYRMSEETFKQYLNKQAVKAGKGKTK